MSTLGALIKLARPHQWAKSVFVLIGPLYGLRGFEQSSWGAVVVQALAAAAAFALASSACYAVNDILDAEADRAHPRKKNRPVASGAISKPMAWGFAGVMIVAAAAVLLVLPTQLRPWVAVMLLLYALNVVAYSAVLKHMVIADVMSLSLGFVLRVLGGCAAVGIGPTTWLLNCAFFLAMFLALGKRLGERKTLEGNAQAARAVQGRYTDDILRMTMIATGVALLITYAGYVQDQASKYTLLLGGAHGVPGVLERGGLNLLWFTMLPATYGLFRCIVLVERGDYDDPTELAVSDRPSQIVGLVFVLLTGGLMWWAMGRPPG